MNENPYQTPTVEDVMAPATTDAEAIRSQHLKHEASLKAVGFLFLLGGLIVAFSTFGLFTTSFSRAEAVVGVDIRLIALLVAIAVGQVVTGFGLRKLAPWSKIPAAILAAISLIRLPIGTIVGAYVLYLIFSAKGKVVLSAGYRDIIAQTPHLRYRTPRWIWILLIVALVFILGVIGLAFVSTASTK